MTKSALARTNIIVFCAIVVFSAGSAGSMMWLFWRHPVATGIATIVVLGAFAVSARLARMMDTENLAELKHGEQRA